MDKSKTGTFNQPQSFELAQLWALRLLLYRNIQALGIVHYGLAEPQLLRTSRQGRGNDYSHYVGFEFEAELVFV